ncbi:hypothetical protein BDM02DRAFT_875936 [Thelephora ganbajun]|uniref:Uncharacterized protein n=1 Tax=Thelephora ganbajun TaxID=370292 RepID=A0ACB6Z5E1_THEGA|nr:hypothetical protein BDM02DRAFT_875936 [Thelephora ganbajun]
MVGSARKGQRLIDPGSDGRRKPDCLALLLLFLLSDENSDPRVHLASRQVFLQLLWGASCPCIYKIGPWYGNTYIGSEDVHGMLSPAAKRLLISARVNLIHLSPLSPAITTFSKPSTSVTFTLSITFV